MFKHEFHKVVDFSLEGDYTLSIVFEDGKSLVIDFSPVLYGEMYGPLREQGFFKKVYIDEQAKTLCWPNGADFDPDLLYNWDSDKDELAERAKLWQSQRRA